MPAVLDVLAVLAVGALVLGACSSQERTVQVIGSSSVAAKQAGASATTVFHDPSRIDQPSGVEASPAGALPGPFSTVVVTITRADGSTVEWCLLVADTEQLRTRGLQQVNDLVGYDGMLFRFGEDQARSFWMQDTPLPLSIAFFRADGGFVSTNDMDPCPDAQSAACPTFAAAARYADAIETVIGAIADAKVSSGSRLSVGNPGCQPRKT